MPVRRAAGVLLIAISIVGLAIALLAARPIVPR